MNAVLLCFALATSAAPTPIPPYMGLSCHLQSGQNIPIDGKLLTSDFSKGWVSDSSANDSSSSVVYGACRGLVMSTLDLDTRTLYATSVANGTGHWRGARIVDSLAESEQDAFLSGSEQDTSTWNIGPKQIDPNYDLGQLYLAFKGTSIYFALERRTSLKACSFEIEISQQPPGQAYRPNRANGDILLLINPDQPSNSYSCEMLRWKTSQFQPISSLSSLKFATNLQPTNCGPWGRIDDQGAWTSDPIPTSQFLEGSIDFESLASSVASNLIKLKGAYVQFRSRTVDSSENIEDVTPIYGIALGTPTAIPYIERGTGTLTLHSDESLGVDGQPIESAIWLMRLVGQPAGTKVDAALAGGDSCEKLTSNTWQAASSLDPVHVIFDIPSTFIDVEVWLEVKSDGQTSRSPGQVVRLWHPISGAFDIVEDPVYFDTPDWIPNTSYDFGDIVVSSSNGLAYTSAQASNVGHDPTTDVTNTYWLPWDYIDYGPPQVFSLANLGPWQGPLLPITQHWQITMIDPTGIDRIVTLNGDILKDFSASPPMPLGSQIIFNYYVTGGTDPSMNPYVSGYLSTLQYEFVPCEPPHNGFIPIVINI